MNTLLKKSLIAMAVTALLGASATAFASESNNGQAKDPVNLHKSIKLKSNVRLTGSVDVNGNINVDSAAISLIDNAQSNTNNTAQNWMTGNTSSIGDSAANGTSGNIGANVATGDNNQQDNAAALSAADASFTFGMADAEVFVNQTGAMNQTLNAATTNASTLNGDAFGNASGNIGVNVTSGNNNQQKNALSASVATTSFAQASVSSNQVSAQNTTLNNLFEDTYMTQVRVALSGSGSGTYSGSGNGNANLGLSGAVDQIGNVYPDMWSGPSHPGGNSTGHFDLDTSTQGGVDLNGDGGALAFGYTPNSSASGTLGFSEAGNVTLNNINLTGSVYYMQISYLPTTNTATLGGNAFSGASGNIGINVSSGTGNQQANSLAMAIAQPSTGGGSTSSGGGTEQ